MSLLEYSTALSMAMMFDPTTGWTRDCLQNYFLDSINVIFQTGMYEMTLVILVKSFHMINLVVLIFFI